MRQLLRDLTDICGIVSGQVKGLAKSVSVDAALLKMILVYGVVLALALGSL